MLSQHLQEWKQTQFRQDSIPGHPQPHATVPCQTHKDPLIFPLMEKAVQCEHTVAVYSMPSNCLYNCCVVAKLCCNKQDAYSLAKQQIDLLSFLPQQACAA